MVAWLQHVLRREDRAHSAFPKDTPIDRVRYVVLDTELTSLDTRSNRLLSIGAIVMDGASIRLNQQFYRVVNPGVDVPEPGVLIHGLRPCDVEQGELPDGVLSELHEFVGDAILVGHFVHIDLKALRKESSFLSSPAIDTARIHRWIHWHEPEGLEYLDLESLARRYGLEFHQAHHALDDAFLTAQLWQRMIHTLQSMKVRDLGALLKI